MFEKKTRTHNFFQVYQFADGLDLILMIIGSLAGN